MLSTDVIDAARKARDESRQYAQNAIDTLEDVRIVELVPEGIVDSALCALEDARNELLRIQVMVAANQVIERR